MTLQLEFGVVLLPGLRVAVGACGLLLCAYAIWRILRIWELRSRQSLTLMWIVLIPAVGACFWLLGRWSRIPVLVLLLAVVFLLLRRITQHR